MDKTRVRLTSHGASPEGNHPFRVKVWRLTISRPAGKTKPGTSPYQTPGEALSAVNDMLEARIPLHAHSMV